MKIKKFLAVLLAVTMIFSMSAVGLTASAASVQPQAVTSTQSVELKSDFELMFSKMFRQMFNGILETFKLYDAMSVTDVEISNNKVTIETGERFDLKAKTLPAKAPDDTLIWESDNITVAIVNSTGTVIGRSAGQATVYAIASDGGFYDSCTVTVKNSSTVSCESLSVSTSSIEFSVGDTETFEINLTPSGAADELSIISSDEDVVSVQKYYNVDFAKTNYKVVLSAVREGNAIVTVKCGNKTKKINVTVNSPSEDTGYGIVYVTLETSSGVQYETISMSFKSGETVTNTTIEEALLNNYGINAMVPSFKITVNSNNDYDVLACANYGILDVTAWHSVTTGLPEEHYRWYFEEDTVLSDTFVENYLYDNYDVDALSDACDVTVIAGGVYSVYVYVIE